MKLLKPLLSVVILLFSLNISAQERPNVILIMADDMGWGDAHYNGHSVIQTPSLDDMANEGIRFDRFYSASPVCSPTRASFLTGRHPHRTGVFTANEGILRPEEITISEVLQGIGYSTGHFGKWHLGTMTHTEYDANRGEPGNTKEYNPPVLHGYDKVFATESKVPTYDPMIKPGTTSTPFGTSFWDENNNKVTDNLSGDASKVVMDRVLPFIDDAKSNDKPFLAVVWFHAPHKPVVAGPEYLAMYNGQTTAKKHYYGCITAMDEQIGRLRDHLQTLGIADNTIITFCSDNGPEDGTPGITKGYKERKRSLYEGGVRVPSVMVWPEKITEQIITDEPFGTSDYFPTILDILDIDLPSDRSYDGESFLPLISDSKFKRDNGIGFAFQHINWSDSKNLEDQLSYQLADYKLYAKDEVFELYNIVNDPFETNDLAGNSSYSDILNDMIEAYKVWLQSVKDSFEGEEYGTTSYDRMGQVFVSPLTDTTPTNVFNDAFSNIAVYPNPTKDMLFITNYKEERLSAVLINLDGKRVYKSSEIEGFVDISSLPSGVYILQIINKNGSEKRFKIVKK
ncbi:sulfatase-like hydrolase/transferase [Carboxylicivirga marina]|uniref:sulfatase-like hydrolase/transferase n=1 Tax=Carboxylicivirga marina TaxID=2800988 RepID=UPI00259453B8|nr:sulfatase-like hydrolase/transferase [uncultured Carboxylicivirga sp.]